MSRSAPPDSPAEVGIFHLRDGGLPPDLTVDIAADRLDERQFDVVVTSPHLPEYEDAPPERWPLRTRAADLVAEYMAELTDTALEQGQLRARLVGFGRKLFADAPENFRK